MRIMKAGLSKGDEKKWTRQSKNVGTWGGGGGGGGAVRP